MYEITDENLTFQLELGDDSPEKVENADGWIVLPNGERWSGTFLTYAELGRVLERWSRTGECLNGTYFSCPDLVLTRRPGAHEMFAAVRDMVANGDHEMSLRRVT